MSSIERALATLAGGARRGGVVPAAGSVGARVDATARARLTGEPRTDGRGNLVARPAERPGSDAATGPRR